jgi:hypothetical protein
VSYAELIKCLEGIQRAVSDYRQYSDQPAAVAALEQTIDGRTRS